MIHSSNNERLKYLHSILATLPEQPGVYRYLDMNDTIIYVGKAKNLKKRVSQYFSKDNLTPKTRVLVSKITDIKFIVVQSEQDAFLLENNLIKLHQPRYNILLKDGKTYPWIVVTKERFPRVIITRNKTNNGSKYFGPYTSSKQAHYIVEIIHSLFPIRSCSHNLSDENMRKRKFDLCLKYHIKLCSAPCCNLIDEDAYSEYITSIHALLSGKFSELISMLKAKMAYEAENLNFEKASKIKSNIELLENYQSRSVVSASKSLSVEVMAVEEEKGTSNIYVNHLHIEDGKLLSSITHKFSRPIEQSPSEVISSAFNTFCEEGNVKSHEIIVNVLPDISFINYHFYIPVSGEKLRLLELSKKNAFSAIYDNIKQNSIKNKDSREETLLSLIQQKLSLSVVPRHIECFDNSNIQGHFPVASCVVFKNAKPSKSDYRKFNIKSVVGPDDYASMYEVVHRRYSRLIEESAPLPDLIIADGGEGQLKVIHQVLQVLNIDIQLVGLVKNNRHKTHRVLVGFPPKEVEISPREEIFAFFTRIQDEVHRFAISFHREKRSKAMLSSEVSNIPGIGPKSTKILLDEFKSFDNIAKASEQQLSNLIGDKKASILYNYINSQTKDSLKLSI